MTAVLGDFVLLQLDFPTHTVQPKNLREQNARLRERFGVTTYPALLVLSASGEKVAAVELAKLDGATQVIAAVADVKKQLEQKAAGPKAPGLKAGATGAGGVAEPEPEEDFLRLMLMAGRLPNSSSGRLPSPPLDAHRLALPTRPPPVNGLLVLASTLILTG